MALIQITGPVLEPVTLDELKNHLRLSTVLTVEDALLNSYITVARKQAENFTRRQLCDATWRLILPGFPYSTYALELPRPPLTTVSSEITVGYMDSSYSTQALGTTFYTVDYNSVLPRIYPSKNSSHENSWGDIDLASVYNAVVIDYVSGYSSASTGTAVRVPEEIQVWIKMKAGMLYNYREPVTLDDYRRIPQEHFNGLLDAYVIAGEAT